MVQSLAKSILNLFLMLFTIGIKFLFELFASNRPPSIFILEISFPAHKEFVPVSEGLFGRILFLSFGTPLCPLPLPRSSGCALKCQENLRDKMDRWPLSLKISPQWLDTFAVLPESLNRCMCICFSLQWSCIWWRGSLTQSKTPRQGYLQALICVFV